MTFRLLLYGRFDRCCVADAAAYAGCLPVSCFGVRVGETRSV